MNSSYYYVYPGSEEPSSFSLLEGIANNPALMELVIKTMEESFNYKLNPEQKAIVCVESAIGQKTTLDV